MPNRANSRGTSHKANRESTPDERLIQAINAVLPQTQCTRCGWPDCTGYAQAIARGEAGINQCPPGGQEGIARLAAVTGQPALPLNPDYGAEGPRHLAVIDEDWCIGCTLCFKACPTDAIAGGNKTMHVVLDDFCTGCELCIPVCPVDCISLRNVTGEAHGWQAWSLEQAATAQARYAARARRLGLRLGQALPPLQQRTGLQLDAEETWAEDEQARQTTEMDAPDAAAHPPQSQPQPQPATDHATDSPPAGKAALLAAIMAKAKAKREQGPPQL